MSDPRFEQVQRIFGQARSMPLGERGVFLEKECGDNLELLKELEELLTHYVEGDSFLESPDGIASLTRGLEEAPKELVPERIGPFKILDVLGEGGMGTVYLAVQKEPIRRRVALKVIKLGMDSRQVLARFELERQALAVMNHECIAKVFEAGTTDRGQPYFVMEYVEGISMIDYCDQHRLTIRERISIFHKICAGVQHAHQKGVIHRDLKPENVLVSRREESAIPKIIDFGLARATDHQLIGQTIYTEKGQLIGTPEYMSPEQAGMDAQAIDTRTDVYSLGVLLYELLSGELPFSPQELRGAGLLEIQRIIKEEEPPMPSARISTLGSSASDHATKRRSSPHAMSRELRGDLDWIVVKAMAKEPERRYDSATAIADDLQRYLEDDPVQAGPPTASYRLQKLARRYRAQITAGIAIVSCLALGIAGTTLFMLEAQRQAENATEALRRSEENFQKFHLLASLARCDLVNATLGRRSRRSTWPADESRLQAWLEEQKLTKKEALELLRTTLDAFRLRANPVEQENIKAPSWRFESKEDQLLHDSLVELLRRIEEHTWVWEGNKWSR